MTMPDPTPARIEELLPLTEATLHILLALADRERHGYGIMREVEERTEGAVWLGPGTLYGSLRRLLKTGLIEEAEERADPDLGDERRRYYRVTPLGLAVVRAELRRLEKILRLARALPLDGLEPAR